MFILSKEFSADTVYAPASFKDADDQAQLLMAFGCIDMRKICTAWYHLEDIAEGMKIMTGKVLISTEYPRL